MECRRSGKCGYILKIHKKSDSEIYEASAIIDSKAKRILLSNKGDYSIYLGYFHTLSISDNDDLEFELCKEYNFKKIYDSFEFIPNSLETKAVIKGTDYIFSDLKEFSGPNLVKSLKRLEAIAYFAKGNKDDINDVIYGLNFIMNNWYKGEENYTGNWWDYEIGATKALVEVLFLIHDYIDKDKIFSYLNITRFYLANPKYLFYRRHYPNIRRELATGANLLDNLYIATLRSILQENKNELDIYFKTINDAIKLTKRKDGFYSDGGFIQHDNVPYNASYGEVLLNSVTKLLNIFSLLDYDCSYYINRMVQLIKASYLPFMYDGRACEAVRGRSCSREMGDSSYSYKIMMEAIKKLYRLFKPRELNRLIKNELNGIYEDEALAFNSINVYIKRNKNYLLSVRANSSYISTYESILNENILGDYQSNFTYDILYKGSKLPHVSEIYTNRFYRNGSTNSFKSQKSNTVIKNRMTAGVVMDGIMLTAYEQNTDVYGFHTKLMLKNSMVAIGSEISGDDFHTTYLNTANDLKISGNSYISGNIKLVTNDDVRLVGFKDELSLHDINYNNEDITVKNEGIRILSENKSEYEYQLYPYYDGSIDSYQRVILEGAHIIRYGQLICISSFTDKLIDFHSIHFKGIFTAIIKIIDSTVYLNLSTGSREPREIYIKIDGDGFLEHTYSITNFEAISDVYKEVILLEK